MDQIVTHNCFSMDTTLLLLHTEENGTLSSGGFEALSAAQTIAAGAPIFVGFVGREVQPAANQIAQCGAARFLGVVGPEFSQARYATDAAAAEALCRTSGATLIVAPATARWNRTLAGVAQRMGGRADSHVTGVSHMDGKIAINRWFYRQRMEGLLHRSQRPWFILVESGTRLPWTGMVGTPAWSSLPFRLQQP